VIFSVGVYCEVTQRNQRDTVVTTNTTLTLDECAVVNITSSIHVNVCVAVEFDSTCGMNLDGIVDNQVVFDDRIDMASISQQFVEQADGTKSFQICKPLPIPTCNICTNWVNVTLNETVFYGCSTVDISCSIFTNPIAPISLGCFQNSGVVEQCFGGCPSHCSFNGICTGGQCTCTDAFTGPTCSTPKTVQCTTAQDCGGSLRGQCVNGVCQCTEQFSGSNCGDYIATANQDSSSGMPISTQNQYIIGFVVSFGGMAIVAVAVFFIWKKRKVTSLTFSKFNSEM